MYYNVKTSAQYTAPYYEYENHTFKITFTSGINALRHQIQQLPWLYVAYPIQLRNSLRQKLNAFPVYFGRYHAKGQQGEAFGTMPWRQQELNRTFPLPAPDNDTNVCTKEVFSCPPCGHAYLIERRC